MAVTRSPTGWLRIMLGALAVVTAGLHIASARSADLDLVRIGAALVSAYPEHLDRVDGGELVWRDGTRMALDDGGAAKPPAAWEAAPDIKDMFRHAYAAGDPERDPLPHADPGRARNAAFFDKMYGVCSGSKEPRDLATVAWLPSRSGQRLRVSRVNGIDRRLAAVSAELDRLPRSFDVFLLPAAGGYTCRPIAGTSRRSPHGYGIAIDIAVARSDYWQWASRGAAAAPYRNRIPLEIVRIFEAHGFIWGGKWSHFDTMHFEYRPELLPPTAALPP